MRKVQGHQQDALMARYHSGLEKDRQATAAVNSTYVLLGTAMQGLVALESSRRNAWEP